MQIAFTLVLVILAVLVFIYCIYEVIDIVKELTSEINMRHRRDNKKDKK